MVADSDSNIAWHRVQLKKNRAELKALETARFTMGEIASSKRNGQTQKAIAELKRKIAQSERVIADHDKRTRRPSAPICKASPTVAGAIGTPTPISSARPVSARRGADRLLSFARGSGPCASPRTHHLVEAPPTTTVIP